MTRRQHVIRVFLASPSDVTDERQLLEDLIRELNDTWGRSLGLRLELVRWETSVLPGVGKDPQAVVEASIGDDYDAFIGLLWTRFGTPTSTHGSGTEQEFEKAYTRAKKDASFHLMVYFNEAKISPTALDPAQLARLQDFRHKLGDRGVLWMTYDGRPAFEQLLRLHLSKLAQDWQQRLDHTSTANEDIAGTATTAPPNGGVSQAPPDDDEGLFDLAEVIQDGLAALNGTVERIGQSIVEVGEQMAERSKEINALTTSGEVDAKRAKRLLGRAAEDVDLFATRLESELPTFSVLYERVVSAVSRSALLQSTIPGAEDPVPDAILAAESLITNTRTTMEGITGMRQAAASWPRLSLALNKARRHAVDALDSLTAEFQKAIDVTEAVLSNLRGSQ